MKKMQYLVYSHFKYTEHESLLTLPNFSRHDLLYLGITFISGKNLKKIKTPNPS